jgi:hypothetical protein
MVSTCGMVSCSRWSEKGGGVALLPDGRWCFGHGLSARDFYVHSHGRRKTPPTLANRDAAPGDTTLILEVWSKSIPINFEILLTELNGPHCTKLG